MYLCASEDLTYLVVSLDCPIAAISSHFPYATQLLCMPTSSVRSRGHFTNPQGIPQTRTASAKSLVRGYSHAPRSAFIPDPVFQGMKFATMFSSRVPRSLSPFNTDTVKARACRSAVGGTPHPSIPANRLSTRVLPPPAWRLGCVGPLRAARVAPNSLHSRCLAHRTHANCSCISLMHRVCVSVEKPVDSKHGVGRAA